MFLEKRTLLITMLLVYCETCKQLIKNNNLADQFYNVDEIRGTVRL